MFDLTQPFFWYKLIFMAELLLSEGLLVYPLRRRRNFIFRAVLCVFGCFLVAFLLPIFFSWWWISILFLLLFAVSLGALAICFDENFFILLFCAILAYTVQHFAYNIYSYLVEIFGVQASNVYEEQFTPIMYNKITAFIEVAVYAITYWFAWAFIYRSVRLQSELKIQRQYLLPFVAVALFLDIVLNALVVYGLHEIGNKVIRTVIFLYSLIGSVFSIGLMLLMIGKGAAENEKHLLEMMWNKDKKTFEMCQSSIEIINLKAHDLKHQIHNLRHTGEIDEQELTEIATAIDIYDNKVETGNKALDVVLSETMLTCKRSNIRFVHFVDGDCLKTLSSGEIYSLFGNALSNAVEATQPVKDAERIIRLTVRREFDFISIHVDNPFVTEPKFGADGLPKTIKADVDFHGFGMRSMKMLAEKHGGTLTCTICENIFNLNILLLH